MKISNILFLLFGMLFCFSTVNCSKTKGDDKIKLKIEVLSKDELLSPAHIKVQKSIVHNGKKINIKVFEKIHQNVLERALVVEEIDKIHSLSDAEKNKLLSVKKSDKDSEEDIIDKDIMDTDDTEDDDGEMKVISTEESKENDIHMIRKVYKETIGNKEITYCYIIFTFNLDLEKLSDVSRSELFKSLDSMPDYLSFLSPNEEISDTESLLEEEYEQLHNDSISHSNFNSMSAAELSHNSEDMQVHIEKYISTLDNIINYIISKSEDSFKLPAFYNELLKEREYLYKLSLEKTENENIINEEYWKNKSKIDKYILYEALTHLNNIFFDNMKTKVIYNKLENDDHMYDSSKKYEKFIDVTDKIIKCHALLNTTEVLDIVILQKISNGNKYLENENNTDKELIEQCVTLFKLLLNDGEDTIEDIKEKRNNLIKNVSKQEKNERLFMNNKKMFNELQNIVEEKIPTKKYMLRKEVSTDNNNNNNDVVDDNEDDDDDNDENDHTIMSFEDAETNDDDYYLEEMDKNFDSDTDEFGEIDELYEPEDNFTDEITSNIPEKEHLKDHSTFLEYDNKISNNDIATEMFNEDPDIADETEDENEAEILEVLKLEKQKMLNNDMNKTMDNNEEPTDYNEESEEEFSDEMISELPEKVYKQNLDSSVESNNEVSDDNIANEMYNEDTSVEDETEEEHKADILEVLNLEKQKLLNNDMNNSVNRDIKPHNKMASSYLENISLIQDDNDEYDSDDNIEDDEDVFSLNNDNDEDNDETLLDQDDTKNDFDDNTFEDIDDNDSGDDDDVDIDFDMDDTDKNDGNEKITHKLKKKVKKEFKKAVNKGKEMAKDALSTLADKAEGHVNKFTSKMTNKIKKKLGSSKDKKKSKKNKNNSSKKSVIKNSSKGIKKDKKKGKKHVKSNGDKLRTPAKTKAQKKSKGISSLEIENKSNKLRKLHRDSSFIGLSDTASKLHIKSSMKKAVNNLNSEMSNLENKKKKILKELEKPTVSDEKIIKDFEEYSEKEQKKKEKRLKN